MSKKQSSSDRRSEIMNEVLTRAEMEAQFDGEWVLVADPELDTSHEV